MYILLFSNLLENIQVDPFIFNAVEVLETEFRNTACKWHLSAFKSQFLGVSGTGFRAFMSAGGCSTFAGTLSSADSFSILWLNLLPV